MLSLSDVQYGYPGCEPVIDGVSLRLAPGERVVLLGRNATGKSTLLRLASWMLAPSSGSVSVDGVDAFDKSSAALIGYVPQDASAQFVSQVVADEVAFGPRGLGLSRAEVSDRVSQALERVGLAGNERRAVDELSFGEHQRLALADALALEPRYLLLDDVYAHLDSSSRAAMRGLVASLAADGVGVLEATGSIDGIASADRVVILSGGGIGWAGSPQELLCSGYALDLAGLADNGWVRLVAPLVRRGFDLSQGIDAPRILAFAKEHDLEDRVRRVLVEVLPRRASVSEVPQGADLRLSYVTFDYAEPERLVERGARPALDDVSLSLAPGTLTLVAGTSGSGKSTAASLMAGLLVPDAGKVSLGGDPVGPGSVGLSFQRPEDQLFCPTVAEDVGFGARTQGVSEGSVAQRVGDALGLLGIGGLAERQPFSLSASERRLVAIAGVVALRPQAYVFDEPSAGLDGAGRRALHALVAMLVNRGAPVVVVSNDVGEWLSHADQVVLLCKGRVVYQGSSSRLAADPRPFAAAGLVPPLSVELASLMAQVAGEEGAAHA